ncbi:MAG: hypothetical protein MUD00_03265 [Candidatus Pacebacteria bacterium]|jgi:prolyl-tRNA editing enzyme YbaK/EbsC (Cys-tRNA(Pro) deacylase)|nr:hypothetical protein [Candidatus Paceibacterota bacterium]
MSAVEREKIKSEFALLGIVPEYIEHEPVITSEDAARTRGFALKQGIKALLFTNGSAAWVIVGIPGDKKADQKKVADTIGWARRDIRMATVEEVLTITGCEIGSVPPFGHKTLVPILIDQSVYDNAENVFNIGLRTDSAKVATDDMRMLFRAIGALEGDFVKVLG